MGMLLPISLYGFNPTHTPPSILPQPSLFHLCSKPEAYTPPQFCSKFVAYQPRRFCSIFEAQLRLIFNTLSGFRGLIFVRNPRPKNSCNSSPALRGTFPESVTFVVQKTRKKIKKKKRERFVSSSVEPFILVNTFSVAA